MQGPPSQQDAGLVASASSRVFPELLPELAGEIVGWMEPNEVPFFRLVNKAAAAQFSSPQHTTIRLSEPVPPHAFAAHWLAPGSTRGLTLKRRRQLLCLTAASGVVANLEVAVRAAGCLPTSEVFEAAASAGKLEPCRWLWEQGCPTKNSKFYTKRSGLLAAAAGGGHRHVCEWLLTLGLAWTAGGAREAARGGHVGLMEWLLALRPQLNPHELVVCGAAHGCELATLQQQWGEWGLMEEFVMKDVLAAAARSPTPDWTAKVEWLDAQGCPWNAQAAVEAVACPDAASRLAWLRSPGYPMGTAAVCAAAGAGNLAALLYLLAEVGAGDDDDQGWERASRSAAATGHLEALQALHAAGRPLVIQDCALSAAENGHVHVLAWLVELEGDEWLGAGAGLLAAAARSGSLELLAWLVERGCDGWSNGATAGAVESGCEGALEWLVARGCPMKEDGWLYSAACRNGDLAMARLLRRLGAPWGPAGRVVSEAACCDPVPMLRWLLEEGCPVGDYEAARARAEGGDSDRAEALQALEDHRAAQQQEGAGAAAAAAAAADNVG
ncbi:hypothetical protein GPECTOR_22g923 [Gonium pectorale]|uniref:Ankyrin repeat domain-containing protein n=1 Tax=Gonium pectorale TaxID=33097 RepID=A0A150GHQ7_GONPE|nr:hypothetical protein GPECTOR_22g923 [Gonium pectorale]|eukprot:KXZ49329.1 hypothetical protein GPECTOR_22g923 [Gonium pectorale]